MLINNWTKRIIGFGTSLFIIWTLSNNHLVESGQASQQENRQLNRKVWRDEPLLIKLVRTKKGVVKIGEKFPDGDDWFQGLTLTIENRSGKPITYIDISLIFRRAPGETGLPLVYSIRYNSISPRVPENESDVAVSITRPPIQPRQSADVTLSENQYESIKALLTQAGYNGGVTSIDIILQEVMFADGGHWPNRRPARAVSRSGPRQSLALASDVPPEIDQPFIMRGCHSTVMEMGQSTMGQSYLAITLLNRLL